MMIASLVFIFSLHAWSDDLPKTEDVTTIKNAVLIPNLDLRPRQLTDFIVKGKLQSKPPSNDLDPRCTLIWRYDFKKKIAKGQELKVRSLGYTQDQTVLKIQLDDPAIFLDFWCANKSREPITFELFQTRLKGVFDLRTK